MNLIWQLKQSFSQIVLGVLHFAKIIRVMSAS